MESRVRERRSYALGLGRGIHPHLKVKACMGGTSMADINYISGTPTSGVFKNYFI